MKSPWHGFHTATWQFRLAKICAAGLACLLASTSRAAPESKESADSMARRACLSGDYQSGLAILSDQFVKTRDPLWIFNQGRCFEQNGKHEEAISRFEEYLRLTKGTQTKDRGEALEHLSECQSKLGKTAPVALAPAVPPPTLAPPPLPPEPVVQVREVKAVREVDLAPVPQKEGSGLRIAGITLGAVGVVALGGGLAFNLLANQTAKELNKEGGYDVDKASTHSTYATLTWVGYAVGGGCLAGGVLLYYLGDRVSHSSSVAFVPSLAPSHAGVSLQGAF